MTSKPAPSDFQCAQVRDPELAEEALRCILDILHGHCRPMTEPERLVAIRGFAEDGLGIVREGER